MIACIAIGIVVAAAVVVPAVIIELALRRHRDLPPASAWAIRRAERRRRLRLGL